MTALVVGGCALLGLVMGVVVNRVAGRYPWGSGGATPAVRPPVVELATALLFALTALRFGLSWELPAFLFLAGVGMLLAVVDARHKTLPNRVTLPSIGIGAALLAVAAFATGEWAALGRAALSAAVLFVLFFVLVLVSPRSIGMGDAKLAALLGLYLGWLGPSRPGARGRGRLRRPSGVGPSLAGHTPDRPAGRTPLRPRDAAGCSAGHRVERRVPGLNSDYRK